MFKFKGPKRHCVRLGDFMGYAKFGPDGVFETSDKATADAVAKSKRVELIESPAASKKAEPKKVEKKEAKEAKEAKGDK